MRRLLGFVVLFSLLTGAVLLLGACGGSSTATTGAPASTGVTGAPMVTGSTTPTTVSSSATATSATTGVTTASTGGPGSKGEPIPLGTVAAVADWKIKVASADLDADAAVKNAPGYQPPDPGSQYVLVNLDATYLAQQPDSFGNALGYRIVGGKGDTFDSVDIGLDKSIESTSAVGQGASISGSLVFVVPSDQIDGALLWMARGSSQEESGTYFALK